MRLPDTVTAAQWASILAATKRVVSARVSVLDRNEEPSGSAVPAIAGSVSVDTSGDVTRSAELTVLDPDGSLGFEAGSPGSGALYADRFVQIDYGIADAALVMHWTPIFRGPVVRYDRSHPEVTIAAQGKESLGLAPNLPLFKGAAVNVHKGARLDDAIATVAAAMGETRLSIPRIPDRLGERVSVGRTKEPWKTILRLAHDGGFQAFYNGAGTLVIRTPPPRPLWSFDAELLSFPAVSYDLGGDFRNVVRVVGEAKSGKHAAPPSYTAEPPPGDPLSPRSLARNGVPRCVAEYIEVDKPALAAVRAIAKRELAARMRQAVAVSFEALTVPGLEEDDPCIVAVPGALDPVAFTARTFSIALGTDQMSLGETRKVRVRKVAG